MAETIPEHISELTASPSRDLAQDVSQDFGDAQYDDNEYPFAQGVMNGAKCCSKCGATKTPQWREGPFGPKTLCNACGVKRTRKLRAEQEGAKRRKTGSQSPAPAKVSYQKATAKAVPAFSPEPINSYGSLELDQFESFAPAAVLPAAMAAARRPTRRAAEEAAAKTRCWAGVVDHHQEEAHIYRAASPAQAATPTSSSDFSHPSSECPEEVAWTPMAADGAKHGMDLDACAAVNLMTMSVRQAGEPLQQPPQQSSPSVSIGQTKDLEQVNHDTLLGLMAKYEGGEAAHHKAVAMDIADLYKCLPPNKVMELVRLNQELDASVHEAHAANAAVAAVAKVLAAKQAAALRARETAGNATKRLRRFMAELDTQFGIQTKLVHSRSRASPKRGPHLMH